MTDEPVQPPPPPHAWTRPIVVVVSPRRPMDVPDKPGTIGADFEDCES